MLRVGHKAAVDLDANHYSLNYENLGGLDGGMDENQYIEDFVVVIATDGRQLDDVMAVEYHSGKS